MSVAFALVAEPTAKYIQRTMLCVHTIRRNAGVLADAPIVVMFNERAHDEGARALERRYGVRIEVRPRIQSPIGYLNKCNAFSSDVTREVDWLLFLDCDTVVCNALDPLADVLATTDAGFAAVPEHARQGWRLERIWAEEMGLKPESFEHLRHPWFRSGLPIFNIGVFAVRSALCPTLAKEAAPFILRYYLEQTTSLLRPLHYLRYKWNRRVWKSPNADRLIWGAHYPRNHGAQISLPILMHKLGVKMHILPHAFNWTKPGTGHGEDFPIRILHYIRQSRIVDGHLEPEADGTEPAWVRERLSDKDPGWQALARVVREFVTNAPSASPA